MAEEVKIAYEQAISLFSLGKKEESVQSLLGLIQKYPDYADAYESLGMIYYKMGDLERAIEWTDRLAAMRPDYAMAHTNLSIFYMKKGNKERAEEEKAKAVVLNFGKAK